MIDMKVDHSRKEELFDTISSSARRNTPGISISKPIVMAPSPPSRDALSSKSYSREVVFKAWRALRNISFVPCSKCDGAALLGAARKNSRAYDLRIHVCLVAYEDSFKMNVFTASTGRRRGCHRGLVENVRTSVIGDSEPWEEITVRDMVSTVSSSVGTETQIVVSSKAM